MAEYAHKDGVNYIREKGQWRPLSRIETSIAQSGIEGQILAGIAGTSPFTPFMEAGQALERINPVASYMGAGAVLGGAAVRPIGSMARRVLARRASADSLKAATAKGTMGFVPKLEQRVPGALQGPTRLIEAGIEGTAAGRIVTDWMIRNPNQRNLNRLILRGLGATDDQIKAAGGKATDEVMKAATAARSAKFEQVGARLTEALDPDKVTRLGLELNRAKLINNDDLIRLSSGEDIGRELMGIRSELLAANRAASTRSETIAIDNAIKAIDDIVKEAMKSSGDDVTFKLWADVRAQDKLARAVNTGQARSLDAMNPSSLDTAMKRYFGKSYTEAGDLSNLPDEVADALRGARAAKSYNVGLPSSGTAERTAAINILKGAGVALAAGAGIKVAGE